MWRKRRHWYYNKDILDDIKRITSDFNNDNRSTYLVMCLQKVFLLLCRAMTGQSSILTCLENLYIWLNCVLLVVHVRIILCPMTLIHKNKCCFFNNKTRSIVMNWYKFWKKVSTHKGTITVHCKYITESESPVFHTVCGKCTVFIQWVVIYVGG